MNYQEAILITFPSITFYLINPGLLDYAVDKNYFSVEVQLKY